MSSRVLFVSKPIVPPWHDGSKNLVRDVAGALRDHRATIMTTRDAFALAGVDTWPVYGESGGFAPGLAANARVMRALLGARGFDTWHFVFAPNVASSTAAHVAIAPARLRGLRRVVQTVASRPKSFANVSSLLFGDVVVALSDWTRARLLAAGVARRVEVVPPCARPLPVPDESARREMRRALDLEGAPIVLYAGDLEVSSGARTTIDALPRVLDRVPEARLVLACRKKTARAEQAEGELRVRLERLRVAHAARFVGETSALSALIHEASVMAFPVDDLYGKVDVPLVLVEALAAGTPLVVAHGGPLETLHSARFVAPRDDEALAARIVELVTDDGARRTHVEAGRALYASTFTPEAVARRYEALY